MSDPSSPTAPPTASPRSSADWLVELCVYAPIGFALDAHRYLPEFVNRGRCQVALARFLGGFAVQRLEQQLGPLGQFLRSVIPDRAAPRSAPPAHFPPSSGATIDDPADPAPAPGSVSPAVAGSAAGEVTPKPRTSRRRAAAAPPAAAPSPAASSARTRSPKAGPPKARAAKAGPAPAASSRRATPPSSRLASRRGSSSARPAPRAGSRRTAVVPTSPPSETEQDLAIHGYGALAASQIVPRLATLGRPELEAIARFERANRGRRTILNRLDQLMIEG